MNNANVDLNQLRIQRSTEPKKSPWGIIITLVVILLVGGGTFYFLTSSGVMAPEVKLTSASIVSPVTASSQFNATGYVVAQRKAAVSSKANGRLVQLNVIEGDAVTEGQIIARIESDDVQAMLSQAKAALEASKARLERDIVELDDAKLNLERQRNLKTQNVGTTAAFTDAEARVRRANVSVQESRANILISEANVRAAAVQVENTVIRAPFSGTVLTKNANIGEVITSLGAAAGARGAVVTLADMNSLEVEADVAEANIEKIRTNQPAEISLDAIQEKSYRGYVSKIIPTADRSKATVQVKVRFNERDSRVLPEMSAKVNFLASDSTLKQAESEGAKVMVPASAIATRQGKKVVFLFDNGIARQRTITIGPGTAGTLVHVTSGLVGGERVVAEPAETVSDGMKLKEKQN